MGPVLSCDSATASRRGLLDALRARCAERQVGADMPAMSLGLAEIDRVLPGRGLSAGMVHEWVGVCPAGTSDSAGAAGQVAGQVAGHRAGQGWSPPLRMLIHFATRAGVHDQQRRPVLWIGERVWPCITALDRALRCASLPAMLRSMLFVRATSAGDRSWATDVALRSGACAIVIADGSGFSMQETRRLQLAAEASRGFCVLARPERDVRALSAAGTRWVVRHEVCGSVPYRRRWSVELLRCKGMRPAAEMGSRGPWVVEHDDAAHALRVVSHVRDGLDAAQAGPLSAPGRTG